MRCRVLKFEVRALAAERRWKVFALDTRHLDRALPSSCTIEQMPETFTISPGL